MRVSILLFMIKLRDLTIFLFIFATVNNRKILLK